MICIGKKAVENRNDLNNSYSGKNSYLVLRLYSLRKSSRAIVIDGAFGLGATISSLRPSCSTALAVAGPKTAIFVSPCTKFGKFSFNDYIPVGL